MNEAAMTPMLLSAADLAGLLACSECHCWRLHAGGKLPLPLKIGRLTRWRATEIEAWLFADAPSRDAWRWTPKGACRCA